ncbi:hypothetical protein Hanom_Chr12g01080451 [Helianthus anomalus]
MLFTAILMKQYLHSEKQKRRMEEQPIYIKDVSFPVMAITHMKHRFKHPKTESKTDN